MVWDIAGLVLLLIVIAVGSFLLCEAIRVVVWMREDEPLIKERDDDGYL